MGNVELKKYDVAIDGVSYQTPDGDFYWVDEADALIAKLEAELKEANARLAEYEKPMFEHGECKLKKKSSGTPASSDLST